MWMAGRDIQCLQRWRTIQPSRTSHEPRFTPRICVAPDCTAASTCARQEPAAQQSVGQPRGVTIWGCNMEQDTGLAMASAGAGLWLESSCVKQGPRQ